MRPLWKIATVALFVASLAMFFVAQPEAKKYTLALLIADLALGWLAFHAKGVEWLLKTWEFDRKWQRRSILETLKIGGGLTFSGILVAAGAMIMLFETCAPVWAQFR